MYKIFFAIMLSQLVGVQRLKAVFIYNIVELHLKSMFSDIIIICSNIPFYWLYI